MNHFGCNFFMKYISMNILLIAYTPHVSYKTKLMENFHHGWHILYHQIYVLYIMQRQISFRLDKFRSFTSQYIHLAAPHGC